ncbi:MAG: beta-lactamase superfamily II metal-dependent hydrolase [Myxococcota bacterium]|jgi:beta-lactamase superfamily II metal-dependent hydrolase
MSAFYATSLPFPVVRCLSLKPPLTPLFCMRLLICLSLLAGWISMPTASSLEVYFIDTGQSDATLLISPTGQTFLFDGGDNGDGNGAVVPLLNSLGISHLDYVGASHYHADHVGGLDEVWNSGIQATVCFDRGDNNQPGTQSYTDYKSRYSSVRQTIAPGQVINLGGGVTLTCIVVDGKLSNGSTVNLSSSAQLENSSSIGYRIDYGDFQMWMGGDLTGGGNSTTDVESSVAPLVGDVDVYQANHHGSRTSSNATWISHLKPEFTVIPCGSSNPYGFPKQEVIDRINHSTSMTPVWCPTDGTGADGFVDAEGTIHLTTDGNTYTVRAADDTGFTAYVDEYSSASPTAGDIVVSEFLSNPQQASDALGEWVEICGVENNVNLNNVELRDAAADNVKFGIPIQLQPGTEILIAADGLSSRNGGVRPQFVWPAGQFSLASSDTVWLEYGSTEIDRVDYTSAWGGNGIASERKDLAAAGVASNFTNATASFGNGDKGTPGADNSADTTDWANVDPLTVQLATPPTRGSLLNMGWFMPGEFGSSYQGFITLGTSPGHYIGSTHIPANQDIAYTTTYLTPGFFGTVPSSEVMPVNIFIPNKNALRNRWIYVTFYTFDVLGSVQVRKVSVPLPMLVN